MSPKGRGKAKNRNDEVAIIKKESLDLQVNSQITCNVRIEGGESMSPRNRDHKATEKGRRDKRS